MLLTSLMSLSTLLLSSFVAAVLGFSSLKMFESLQRSKAEPLFKHDSMLERIGSTAYILAAKRRRSYVF